MSLPDDNDSEEPKGEPEEGSPDKGKAVGSPDGAGGEVTPAENTNFQRIIEQLPPEARAEIFAVFKRETMSHSGWLPTPAFMREYDEVLPGLAERIVALPEREQGFRHDTTHELVRRDYGLRSTGQWMGMAALVIILAFCAFLAALGATQSAAWVAGTVIIGTVGIFVTGQLVGNKSTSKDVIESDDDE